MEIRFEKIRRHLWLIILVLILLCCTSCISITRAFFTDKSYRIEGIENYDNPKAIDHDFYEVVKRIMRADLPFKFVYEEAYYVHDVYERFLTTKDRAVAWFRYSENEFGKAINWISEFNDYKEESICEIGSFALYSWNRDVNKRFFGIMFVSKEKFTIGFLCMFDSTEMSYPLPAELRQFINRKFEGLNLPFND